MCVLTTHGRSRRVAATGSRAWSAGSSCRGRCQASRSARLRTCRTGAQLERREFKVRLNGDHDAWRGASTAATAAHRPCRGAAFRSLASSCQRINPPEHDRTMRAPSARASSAACLLTAVMSLRAHDVMSRGMCCAPPIPDTGMVARVRRRSASCRGPQPIAPREPENETRQRVREGPESVAAATVQREQAVVVVPTRAGRNEPCHRIVTISHRKKDYQPNEQPGAEEADEVAFRGPQDLPPVRGNSLS